MCNDFTIKDIEIFELRILEGKFLNKNEYR